MSRDLKQQIEEGLAGFADADLASASVALLNTLGYFLAFFRRFSLAYLLRYGPNAEGIQRGVPYALYRLGLVAETWRKNVVLAEEIMLPGIRQILAEEIGESRIWTVGGLVTSRVVDPLIEWGPFGRRLRYGQRSSSACFFAGFSPGISSSPHFLAGPPECEKLRESRITAAVTS